MFHEKSPSRDAFNPFHSSGSKSTSKNKNIMKVQAIRDINVNDSHTQNSSRYMSTKRGQ